MSTGDKIYVTKPHLPPLEEFLPHLERIWNSRVLTNSGPYHREFEAALGQKLGVEHVSLFTNATIALVTALQVLRIGGEVITTPYSFVATAHALGWNGIRPVFVDIDPVTLTLDPERIEAAITPQTSAILGVHVYGSPCDTNSIGTIADSYGLKVIYDAAHAFGATRDGRSVCAAGDLSVLSFHATKVFNTFEGGAIIGNDAKTKQRIDYLKNFGYADEVTVVATGINGKMNEFQAALGLLQLQHVEMAIARRAAIDARYRELLADVRGLKLWQPTSLVGHNFAYFPVFIEPDYPLTRDGLNDYLRANGIYGRRYFYPLISDFPMYRGLPSATPGSLPVAQRVASQVLCLPIYPDLADADVDRIAMLIADAR